jgi:Fe-S cluster assembly iron-binding protein IscA
MTLAVTPDATQALKRILDDIDHEEGQVLRLVADMEGRLGLALDTENDDDQVVQYDGSTVLVVAPPISTQLSGATLDAKNTSEGLNLTILPPGQD